MDAIPTTGPDTSTREGAGVWWSVLLLGLAAAVAVGCSQGSKEGGRQDTAGGATGGGDTGLDGDEADTGTEPAWWRLDADLEVVDGAVEPSAVSLRLQVVGADGDERCADTVVPTEWTDAEELPHETVYTWWSVELPEEGWTCFAEGEGPRAGPLLLGVGAMHPEVEALVGRLDDAGDGAGDALNGAYAGLPGDDRLLVFGVAGPEDAWDGAGVPATEAPLADGDWKLRAVYAFAL